MALWPGGGEGGKMGGWVGRGVDDFAAVLLPIGLTLVRAQIHGPARGVGSGAVVEPAFRAGAIVEIADVLHTVLHVALLAHAGELLLGVVAAGIRIGVAGFRAEGTWRARDRAHASRGRPAGVPAPIAPGELVEPEPSNPQITIIS